MGKKLTKRQIKKVKTVIQKLESLKNEGILPIALDWAGWGYLYFGKDCETAEEVYSDGFNTEIMIDSLQLEE